MSEMVRIYIHHVRLGLTTAGGKCGAINLDRNLRDLLSARFGDKFDSLPAHLTSSGSLMMYDFERNKQVFDTPCPRLRHLRLFMDVEDPEHYDSFDSAVILSEKVCN